MFVVERELLWRGRVTAGEASIGLIGDEGEALGADARSVWPRLVHAKGYTAKDVRGTCVCVPAALVKLESDVDDSLVVQEPSAHDPVARHEAREMRANVPDGAAIVEIREVRPVADSGSLAPGVRKVLCTKEAYTIPSRVS